MSPSANNFAFTAPINPRGATPVLTRSQVWTGLLLKIRSAETFIPRGIQSTSVISEEVDAASGNPVTVRDVVFVADQRKVRERVTAYEQCRVDFVQTQSGSFIQNVLSEDENGELFLTYVFEWRHPGASEAELKVFAEKERGGKAGVTETIAAMRELVKSGKI